MRDVVGGDAAVLLCDGAALDRTPESLIAAGAAATADDDTAAPDDAAPPNGRVVLLAGACRDVGHLIRQGMQEAGLAPAVFGALMPAHAAQPLRVAVARLQAAFESYWRASPPHRRRRSPLH